MHVPAFDGQRSSFLNYEEKVLLRENITPLEPAKKASHLLLRTVDVARKVCLTVGKDVVGNNDGVEQILNISRNRFAPGKADCTFQDIAKFLYSQRTTQDMDTLLLEFDISRQKAEARISMGTGFRGEFAPALCMQNASLSKNERQLVIASVGSSLSFVHVAAQVRR